MILREEAAVTCTILSNNTKHHIDTRIKTAHIAFYGLQSGGLCADGVSPLVSAHMLSVAIQPILSYGCSTLNADRNVIKELDKAQAKLLKFALGLPKFCHNIPLLEALALKEIAKTLQVFVCLCGGGLFIYILCK